MTSITVVSRGKHWGFAHEGDLNEGTIEIWKEKIETLLGMIVEFNKTGISPADIKTGISPKIMELHA